MKNFQLEKDRIAKAPGFAKASDFALWASLSAATQQVELPTPLFELRRDKTIRQAKSAKGFCTNRVHQPIARWLVLRASWEEKEEWILILKKIIGQDQPVFAEASPWHAGSLG
jgi:hypothetical protein